MKFLSIRNRITSTLRSRLQGQIELQEIIRSVGWLSADRIVRMGVSLLVGVWIARYLGPEQFGFLNYGLAFGTLFSALSVLGLSDITPRNLVQQSERTNEILGTTFGLKCLGGCFGYLMAVVVALWLEPNNTSLGLLVGIVAIGLIAQSFDTIDYWFQSQVQAKPVAIARNAALWIGAVLKVILIVGQASVIMFGVAFAIEYILSSLGLLFVYQRAGQSVKNWSWRSVQAKALLRDSWPLIFSTAMGLIYLRIDQVMLGSMFEDTAELGRYSVAVRLVEVWYLFPMVVYTSVLPSIVKAREIGDDVFYARLQRFYNSMALLAYVIAIPMTLFADVIISTLFGEAYQGAEALLMVLIWSLMFTNLGVARSAFLIPMNWTKVHLATMTFAGVANVISNYYLIPIYGGMGAVVSSFLAYWLAAHGACFFYRPLHKTGWMLTKAMFYPKVW